MLFRMKGVWLAALALIGCTPAAREGAPPLEVVPWVDLERYAGTWYEIARLPNSFQIGCVGTKATYTLLEDGRVGVINECRKGSMEGPLDRVQGTARVADPKTNAKLKVSFFWPFYGDYWVIELGDDYQYAVVGHPSREYLWILSRRPQLDEGLYGRIVERLGRLHYDTGKLQRTPHTS
jgi:apolipoprotein D and lipocalin family protein